MQILNDKNFLLYAIKNYDNPSCRDIEEFNSDIRRIKYIKKLLTRYIESGILKERLILNHLIILSNVFSPEALCRILYLKVGAHMKYLKPFLILLGIMSEKIINIREEKIIDTNLIDMDEVIIKRLRNI